MSTSIPHAEPGPRSESEPGEPRAPANVRRIGTWLQVEGLIGLYEAYQSTVQALSALDAGNFGIAETRLRASEANVTVADGLETQRSVLLELVARLDEQLGLIRADMRRPNSVDTAQRTRE